MEKVKNQRNKRNRNSNKNFMLIRHGYGKSELVLAKKSKKQYVGLERDGLWHFISIIDNLCVDLEQITNLNDCGLLDRSNLEYLRNYVDRMLKIFGIDD